MTEGSPRRNPPRPTRRTALGLGTPESTSERVTISTIEMRLVNAAKERARKNKNMNADPSGRVAKSSGIQMKVSPSLFCAKIVSCTTSGVSPFAATASASPP